MDATIPKYSYLRKEVSSFLRKVGYNPEKVPLSQSLDLRVTTWLRDPQNLIDTKVPPSLRPKRPSDKPLRLPIQDVYKIGGIGTVPVGRIKTGKTGILKPTMLLTFGPTGLKTELKSMQMHHDALQEALPGDNVGFNVKNVTLSELKRCYVASNAKDDPAKPASGFFCNVLVLNHPGQIGKGYAPELDCHTSHTAARFDELLSKNDRRSGELVEMGPKFLKNGDAAVVKMVPTKPLVVEAFSEYPPLGRWA